MLAANMENTTMRMRIETSLAVKEESSVRRVALLCIVLLLVLMFPCTERSAAASTGKTVGMCRMRFSSVFTPDWNKPTQISRPVNPA